MSAAFPCCVRQPGPHQLHILTGKQRLQGGGALYLVLMILEISLISHILHLGKMKLMCFRNLRKLHLPLETI